MTMAIDLFKSQHLYEKQLQIHLLPLEKKRLYGPICLHVLI